MSKYKYTLESYYYDATGYYTGKSDLQSVTVYAANDEAAIKKGRNLRPVERRTSHHNTLAVEVIAVEELLS